MFHITESLIWAVLVGVKRYWKNWSTYQITIIYVICCDLIYNFLTYNY